jgi:hypothetical protein
MTIYSQRDSRWKNEKLGFGNTTIGDYGCTITCVAMMADIEPSEVNQRLKSKNGFTGDNGNLILWSKIKEAIPWLEWQFRGYGYDNDVIKEVVKNNGSCLVEVDFDNKISSPNDHHWVLYVGNQKLWDAWTGVEKATSWYQYPTGYSIINRLDEDDPIPPSDSEPLKKFVEGLGTITWDRLIEEYGYEHERVVKCREERDAVEREITTLRDKKETLEKHIDTYLLTLANLVDSQKDEEEIIKKIRMIISDSLEGTTNQKLIEEVIMRLLGKRKRS